MTELIATDTHATELLMKYAPQSFEFAPILQRLFSAIADGHSFIYLNRDEQTQIAQAAPIVATHGHAPLILVGNRLFIGKYYQIEQQLANEISRLSHTSYPIQQAEQMAQLLQLWFNDSGSLDQQAAAALALSQNFTVISGGPGTGKTTTVAKLLALLCTEKPLRIALTAPTGKAAARMSEALKNAVNKIPMLPETTAQHLLHLEGKTVHRLLGLTPPQMKPTFHAHNRLSLDALIIDETSMLDTYLLLQLLQALPDACRVILLGDENQLPSVGAGAVLAALVRSSFRLPENQIQQLKHILPRENYPTLTQRVAKLTISHRFGAQSGIGCLARAIVAGDAELAWQQFALFPHELTHQQANIKQQAKQLHQQHQAYWAAIASGDIQTAFAEQAKIMVLTALRHDAAQFNATYRKILQHYGLVKGETLWFAGQMLMITRNDPATHLFNGDMGIVMQQDDGLMAYFPDVHQSFRAVPLSRLPAHEDAFAMTVHKSQGSEYDEVWLLPPSQTENACSRTLLYTALTRAKSRFVYWGDKNDFQATCKHQETRRTALSNFLTPN